ncbi:MAG: hypothetical protein IPJ37_02920 [Bacteroidales bacterium]|nr:hypothetical protein [Bacteroidales bacterium]
MRTSTHSALLNNAYFMGNIRFSKSTPAGIEIHRTIFNNRIFHDAKDYLLSLIPFFIILLFSGSIAWGQSPTNPGFEDALNNWTNIGTGTESVNTTSPRTGINRMSYSTNSTTSQEMRSSGTVTVNNNNYVHIIGYMMANNTDAFAAVGVRQIIIILHLVIQLHQPRIGQGFPLYSRIQQVHLGRYNLV